MPKQDRQRKRTDRLSRNQKMNDPRAYKKPAAPLASIYRVELGEFLNKRYLNLKELGNGAFSHVYEVKDLQQNRYVAAKILKRGCKRDAVGEIKVMQTITNELLRDTSAVNVVSMLDSFEINGCFPCFTSRREGVNLYDLAEHLMKLKGPQQTRLSLPTTKAVMRQLLEGLDFLHTKCGVIHTDIKPENLVICRHQPANVVSELLKCGLSPKLLGIKDDNNESTHRERPLSLPNGVVRPRLQRSLRYQLQKGTGTGKDRGNSRKESEESTATTATDGRNAEGSQGESLSRKKDDLKIMLIDLGSSQYINEVEVTAACTIQTLEYRCPESILLCEKYFQPVVDIWSAACMAFELATGAYLFEPPHTSNPRKYHSDHENDVDRDIAHLKLIARLVRIPAKMISKSKLKQALVGRRNEFEFTPRTHTFYQLLKEKYNCRNNTNTPEDQEVEKELAGLANFLDYMLQADPEVRPTAAECLQHPWMNS
jgi:serine/threonine protein kinase